MPINGLPIRKTEPAQPLFSSDFRERPGKEDPQEKAKRLAPLLKKIFLIGMITSSALGEGLGLLERCYITPKKVEKQKQMLQERQSRELKAESSFTEPSTR